MKIRPLRDIIVAVPLEDSGKVGLLYMPDNKLQALATHQRMLVIAAGPKAEEQGCFVGVIIHASERWGEALGYGQKVARIGRSRDINGICPGEKVADKGKYLD